MEIEGWLPWEPVRRPLFDGVGWKVFLLIVTANVRAVGLGHTLDLDRAALARSADEKVFKEEDAKVRTYIMGKLSKRLARKARSFKTAIEMISWLRNEYSQDGTYQQVTTTEKSVSYEQQTATDLGVSREQEPRKAAKELNISACERAKQSAKMKVQSPERNGYTEVKNKQIKCHYCRKKGHIRRNCTVKTTQSEVEREGKREGKCVGGKTQSQTRKNQADNSFQKLSKFGWKSDIFHQPEAIESKREEDEGSYWFSLRESDSEDDDNFGDESSTHAIVWASRKGSKGQQSFNKVISEAKVSQSVNNINSTSLFAGKRTNTWNINNVHNSRSRQSNSMFVGENIIQNSNTEFNGAFVVDTVSVVDMQMDREIIVSMQTDRESAMGIQVTGKSVMEAEVSVLGMQMDKESARNVQIDGKCSVDADAGVMGVQIDGKSVMNADESVVDIDFMGSGIVSMQANGESSVDVTEGIVDTVFMSSSIMDMQTDGNNVVEVVESIVDAGVMDDFIDDAGASCDSDADCKTCNIMDSVCTNYDDHGSMEMDVKAPDKGYDLQQGQSLWKGFVDPGGVKQYVMQQEFDTEYVMQQECVTEQRQSLWKQILDPGGVRLFGIKMHDNEKADVKEVDPGGVKLSAENGGQSEGLYRTVNDDVENCVDFPTGIGDMEVLTCVAQWVHNVNCMLVMLRFMAWNMVYGRILMGGLIFVSCKFKAWDKVWSGMSFG